MNRPGKILIVDDDRQLVDALYRFFIDEKADVIKCYNEDHARLAVKSTFFDLVLLDLNLTKIPGREGMNLLLYIKEQSPGTRVIFITGYSTEELEREVLGYGADCYFAKPVSLDTLRLKLAEFGISRELQ